MIFCFLPFWGGKHRSKFQGANTCHHQCMWNTWKEPPLQNKQNMILSTIRTGMNMRKQQKRKHSTKTINVHYTPNTNFHHQSSIKSGYTWSVIIHLHRKYQPCLSWFPVSIRSGFNPKRSFSWAHVEDGPTKLPSPIQFHKIPTLPPNLQLNSPLPKQRFTVSPTLFHRPLCFSTTRGANWRPLKRASKRGIRA